MEPQLAVRKALLRGMQNTFMGVLNHDIIVGNDIEKNKKISTTDSCCIVYGLTMLLDYKGPCVSPVVA